jgi:hypothetical protein
MTLTIRKEKREEIVKKSRQGLHDISSSTNVSNNGSRSSVGMAIASHGTRNNGAPNTGRTVANPRAPKYGDIAGFKRVLLSTTTSLEEKTEATQRLRILLCFERNAREVQAVVRLGILPILIQNLTSDLSATTLINESAWVLTNISEANGANHVSAAGANKPLIFLMTHGNAEIRETAIECLLNIAGAGPKLGSALLELGIVEPM